MGDLLLRVWCETSFSLDQGPLALASLLLVLFLLLGLSDAMSNPNEFLLGLSGWVEPVAHVVGIGILLVDGVSKQAHTASLLYQLKQVVIESLPVYQTEISF